jgi:hypothetical protein
MPVVIQLMRSQAVLKPSETSSGMIDAGMWVKQGKGRRTRSLLDLGGAASPREMRAIGYHNFWAACIAAPSAPTT